MARLNFDKLIKKAKNIAGEELDIGADISGYVLYHTPMRSEKRTAIAMLYGAKASEINSFLDGYALAKKTYEERQNQ